MPTADFPPAKGGIQVLVHRVASLMDAFDVLVVAPHHEQARNFDAAAGVAVHRSSLARGPSPQRVGALNASALAAAARFRPHITLSAHVVTSPAAAALARLAGVPYVQYFYANEIAGRPRLAAFAGAHAKASISISAYTTRLMRGVGVDEQEIRLILPGVDLPESPRALPAQRPTILTVSRIADSYKGHDVLLRALALVRERVPEVHWVVVGDGPLRADLQDRARTLGLDAAASFLGAVPDAERDEWLRRCDVFAMPSRLPDDGRAGEGFGIVYLEAAAYGKPVLAGNVGGATDAVLADRTGLLVDPADPAAVAGALTRLLLDRDLAARLGAAGAERARELAWPAVARRVQDLLLETLAAR